MKRVSIVWVCRCILLSAIFSMAGCASLRNGGAQESLPVIPADRKAIDQKLDVDGLMSTLLESPLLAETRNKFIRARLVAIDIRYFEFITNLQSDRQTADAGVQLAQIALGVAGVATSGTRTKSNLAAAAATLAGVKAVIDKEYYFDKTVPALVAIMNAKRLGVLKEIRRSMTLDPDTYGAQDVIAHLDQYARVGHLAEAVTAVEVLAKAQEIAFEAEIRTIAPASAENIDLTGKLNLLLAKLKTPDVAKTHQAKISKVIELLGGTPDPKHSYDESFSAMRKAFRVAGSEQLQAAFDYLSK